MSTTLKIKVTKEILNRSAFCGRDENIKGPTTIYMGDKCAIALAVRDVFPTAYVMGDKIQPFGLNNTKGTMPLPPFVSEFIREFDLSIPDERKLLPEIEFEITIPDEVIEQINIEELRPLLIDHPTLELI